MGAMGICLSTNPRHFHTDYKKRQGGVKSAWQGEYP